MSLAGDQMSAREDGQMRRHGVLGNLDQARQFAGRNAFGLPRDQQSEGVEPGRLGERRQRGYDFRIIHISTIPDIQNIASSLRAKFDGSFLSRGALQRHRDGAYPRETQEIVFDAHERVFAFFKGACTRGVCDNSGRMLRIRRGKMAVEAIFIGKDRRYNPRFLQMRWRHLVDPVACTPASGWETGQVENQVGLVRDRFFTPRLRFKSDDELNAWLPDKCVGYAKAHPHPGRPERTVWEAFEEERPKLVPYRGRFDGFHALPASVSKTCLALREPRLSQIAARAFCFWHYAYPALVT